MNLLRHRVIKQTVRMFGLRFCGLALSAAGSIWAARCLGAEKLGISGLMISAVATLGLLTDLNQNVGLVRRFKASASAAEQSTSTTPPNSRPVSHKWWRSISAAPRRNP